MADCPGTVLCPKLKNKKETMANSKSFISKTEPKKQYGSLKNGNLDEKFGEHP